MDDYELYDVDGELFQSLDDAGDEDNKKPEDGKKPEGKKPDDKKPDDKGSKNKKSDKKNDDKENKGISDPMLMAIKIAVVLVVIVYYVLLIFGKKLLGADNEFFRSLYLFSKDGDFEPIRFYRILSLVIMVLTVREVLTWIFDKIIATPELTKKTGTAIIGLFQSAVRYTAVLVLFFMILRTLGMNTTELLAGVGILTMIVGLGAESIVADIVAGFFILIEHLYDVGDIITVDNFYGKVIAIGIRSTKIEDKSQNIKIIRNSSIGTLINMTEKKTMLALHLVLDYDVDLIRAEKIIKDALPAMKEKIPDIIDGPTYLGVTNIDGNGLTIRIIAGCNEAARPRVKRKLFRELKLLFDEYNISFGWNNYIKHTD